MRDFHIRLDEEALKDQREKLVEKYGITKEEADQIWENTRLNINLASQEADCDWDAETLDDITNFMLSIQQQFSDYLSQRKRRNRQLMVVDAILQLAFVLTALSAYSGFLETGLTPIVGMNILGAVVLFLWLSVGRRLIGKP